MPNMSVTERLRLIGEWFKSHPYSRATTFVRTLVPSDAPVIAFSFPREDAAPFGENESVFFPSIEDLSIGYAGVSEVVTNATYCVPLLPDIFFTALRPRDFWFDTEGCVVYVIAEDGSLWTYGYGVVYDGAYGAARASHMDVDSISVPQDQTWMDRDGTSSPSRGYLAQVHVGPFVSFEGVCWSNSATNWFIKHEDGSFWSDARGKLRAHTAPGYDRESYGMYYFRASYALQQSPLFPSGHGDPIALLDPYDPVAPVSYATTPLGVRALDPVLGDSIASVFAHYNKTFAISKSGRLILWGDLDKAKIDLTLAAAYAMREYGEVPGVYSCDAGNPLALDLPRGESAVHVAITEQRVLLVTDAGRVYGLGECYSEAGQYSNQFGGRTLPSAEEKNGLYSDADSWILLYAPEDHNPPLHVSRVQLVGNPSDEIILQYVERPHIWYGFGLRSEYLAGLEAYSLTQPVPVIPETAKWSILSPASCIFWTGSDDVLRYVSVDSVVDFRHPAHINSYVEDAAYPEVRTITMDGEPVTHVINVWAYDTRALLISRERASVPAFDTTMSMDVFSYYSGWTEAMKVDGRWVVETYARTERTTYLNRYMTPFFDVAETLAVFSCRYALLSRLPVSCACDTNYTSEPIVSSQFAIDFIQSTVVTSPDAFTIHSRAVSNIVGAVSEGYSGQYLSPGLLVQDKEYATLFHTESTPVVYYDIPYAQAYGLVSPALKFNEVFSFCLAKNNSLSGIGRVPSSVVTTFSAWGAKQVDDLHGVDLPFTGQGEYGLVQYTGEGIRQLVSFRDTATNLGTAIALDNDHVARLVLPPDSWATFLSWYQNNISGAFYPGIPDVKAVYPAGAEQQGLLALMQDGSVHVWYSASKTTKAVYAADPSLNLIKAGVGLNAWSGYVPDHILLLSANGQIYAVGSNNLRWFYNRNGVSLSGITGSEHTYSVPVPADALGWVDLIPSGCWVDSVIEACAIDSLGRLHALGPSGSLIDTHDRYNSYITHTAANTPVFLVDTDVREAKVWFERPYLSGNLYNQDRYTVAYLKKGQLHIKGSNPRWTGRYDHTFFKVAAELAGGYAIRRLPFITDTEKETLASLYLAYGTRKSTPMIPFGAYLVAPRLTVAQGGVYATSPNPTIGWPVLSAEGPLMIPMPLVSDLTGAITDANSRYPYPPVALPGSGGLIATSAGVFFVPGVTSPFASWFSQIHVWEFDDGVIDTPYTLSLSSTLSPVGDYQVGGIVYVVGGVKNSDTSWTLLVDQSWYDYGIGQTKQRILSLNFTVDRLAKVLTLVQIDVLRDIVVPVNYGDHAKWFGGTRPFCTVGGMKVFAYGKHIFTSVNGATWFKHTTSLPWDDDSASGTVPSTLFTSAHYSAYARIVCGLYPVSDTHVAVLLGDTTLWVVEVAAMSDMASWVMVGQPSSYDATYPNTVAGMGARLRWSSSGADKGIASLWCAGNVLYAHLPNINSDYEAVTLSWVIGDSRLSLWQVGANPRNILKLSTAGYADGYGVFGPVLAGDLEGSWNYSTSYAYTVANASYVGSVSQHPELGIFMSLWDTGFRAHTVLPHPVPGRQFIGLEERYVDSSTVSHGARRTLVLLDDANCIWHYGGWSGGSDNVFPDTARYPDTPTCQNGTFNRVFIAPQYIGEVANTLGTDVVQAMPQYHGYYSSASPSSYLLLAANTDRRSVVETSYSVSAPTPQYVEVGAIESVFAIDYKTETYATYSTITCAVLETLVLAHRTTISSYDSQNCARYYLAMGDAPTSCSSASLAPTLNVVDIGVGIPCSVRSATVTDAAVFASGVWSTSSVVGEVAVGSSVKYLPVSIYFQLAYNTRLMVGIGLRDASVTAIDGVEWWMGTDYLSASFNFAGVRIVVDFGVLDATALYSAYAAHTSRNETYWRVRRLDCYLRIDGAVGTDLMRTYISVPKVTSLTAELAELTTLRIRERSGLDPVTTAAAYSTDIPVDMVITGDNKDSFCAINTELANTIDGGKLIEVQGSMSWVSSVANRLPDTSYISAVVGPASYASSVVVAEAIPDTLWMGIISSQLVYWVGSTDISFCVVYASSDGVNWRAWVDVTPVYTYPATSRYPLVEYPETVLLYRYTDNGVSTTRSYSVASNGDIAMVQGTAILLPRVGWDSTTRGGAFDYVLPLLGGLGKRMLARISDGVYPSTSAVLRVVDYLDIDNMYIVDEWAEGSVLSLPWVISGASLPEWVRRSVLYSNVVYVNADRMVCCSLDLQDTTQQSSVGRAIVCHKVRTIGGSVWRWFSGTGIGFMSVLRHPQYPSVLWGFQQVYKETPEGKYVYMETAIGGLGGARGLVHPDLAPIPTEILTVGGEPVDLYIASVFVDEAYNEPGTTVISIRLASSLYAPEALATLFILEREAQPTVSFWVVGPTHIFLYHPSQRKVLVRNNGVFYGSPYTVTSETSPDDTEVTITPVLNGGDLSAWRIVRYTGVAIEQRYIGPEDNDPDQLQLVPFDPVTIPKALHLSYHYTTFGYEVDNAVSAVTLSTKVQGVFAIDFKIQATFDDVEVQAYAFRNVYQQLTDYGRNVGGVVVGAAGGLVVALEARRNVWLAVSSIGVDGSFLVAVPPSSERIYLVAITSLGEVCRVDLETM